MKFIVKLSVILILITLITVYLQRFEGEFIIEFLSYKISTTMPIAIFLFLTIIIIISFLTYLFIKIFSISKTLKQQHKINKIQAGLKNLEDTLIAFSMNDYRKSVKNLQKSRKKLGEMPVHNLLNAQISYKMGNIEETKKSLENLQDSKADFIATISLASLAKREGDFIAAEKYIKKSYKIAPNNKAVIMANFEFCLRNEEWQKAEYVISRHKIDNYMFYKSILYYMQAKNNDNEILAKEAYKADITFIPAILLYAKIMLSRGEDKKSWRIILNSWKKLSHPLLVDFAIKLTANKNDSYRMKIAKTLMQCATEPLEGQIAFARFAVICDRIDIALNHLRAAISIEAEPRIYHLLSEIEHKYRNNERASKEWLKNSHGNDDVWICKNCNNIEIKWHLNCSHCDSFLSIYWGKAENIHDKPITLLNS